MRAAAALGQHAHFVHASRLATADATADAKKTSCHPALTLAAPLPHALQGCDA